MSANSRSLLCKSLSRVPGSESMRPCLARALACHGMPGRTIVEGGLRESLAKAVVVLVIAFVVILIIFLGILRMLVGVLIIDVVVILIIILIILILVLVVRVVILVILAMLCRAVAAFVFRYSVRNPLAKPDRKPAGSGDPGKKRQLATTRRAWIVSARRHVHNSETRRVLSIDQRRRPGR